MALAKRLVKSYLSDSLVENAHLRLKVNGSGYEARDGKTMSLNGVEVSIYFPSLL